MGRAARGNREARGRVRCGLERSKRPLNSRKGFEPLILHKHAIAVDPSFSLAPFFAETEERDFEIKIEGKTKKYNPSLFLLRRNKQKKKDQSFRLPFQTRILSFKT